jgi:general secretion pathway protein J
MRGFTLIEILIALFIMSILGVSSTAFMSSMVSGKESIEKQAHRLTSLQRSSLLIRQDMQQITNRSVRNIYGDKGVEPAVVGNGLDYIIEFTRKGWPNNPSSTVLRSQLQRVAYSLSDIQSDVCKPALDRLQSQGITEPEGQCMLRHYWKALDRTSEEEATTWPIVDLLNDMDIQYLGGKTTESEEQWYRDWPPQTVSSEPISLRAVKLNFVFPNYGEVYRVFAVAAP